MINKEKLPNNGVTFMYGDVRLHSFNDFGLLWMGPADGEELVTAPVAKTHIISGIPGTDGIIDLTEKFGEVRFENRIMNLKFISLHDGAEEGENIRERLFNKLHGRKATIILDSDPKYYWQGRISVDKPDENEAVSDIQISAEVFPYKRKNVPFTDKFTSVTGSKTVTVTNSGRMPAPVNINSNKAISLYFNGTDYDIEIGDNLAVFELTEGDNSIVFECGSETATITIEHEEGSL